MWSSKGLQLVGLQIIVCIGLDEHSVVTHTLEANMCVWAKVVVNLGLAILVFWGAILGQFIVVYGCFRSFTVVWAIFTFFVISGYFWKFLCLVLAGSHLLGSLKRFSLPGMVTNWNPSSRYIRCIEQ